MTKERAKELIRLQSDFPYWGNFSRFMTSEEIHETNQEWDKLPGNTSFASVIYMAANAD